MISACSTIKPQVDTVTIHPDLPRPIQPLTLNWVILQDHGNVYVGTKYNDFLNFLQNRNDELRYIKQLRLDVCYYRKSLHEDFCKNILPKDQPTKKN